MNGVNFPFGYATSLTPTPAAGVASAAINDNFTLVNLGTLDANTTLNLVVDDETRVGAAILVKYASDGTARNLTFGTGITATAITGTINKTKTKLLIFDGTTFIGLNEQIN